MRFFVALKRLRNSVSSAYARGSVESAHYRAATVSEG